MRYCREVLQQRWVHRVPMVNSARCLDAKENHKVVVEEEGKPDQKYMSLTESLWTKSFDSRKSDLSHREQSGNQLCLGDHSNPTNNSRLTSSNQSWPSWTSGAFLPEAK